MNKELQALLEIEEKYNLCGSKIGDVPVWMYIRYLVLREEFLGKAFGRKSSQKSMHGSVKDDFSRVFKVFCDDIFTRKNVRQSDYLFIAHERRVKIAGKYKCIYTAGLSDYYAGLKVSVLRNDEYRSDSIDNDQIYIGLPTIYGEMWYLIFRLIFKKRYKKLLDTVREQWDAPLREMESVLGISADKNKIIAFAVKRIIMTPVTRKYVARSFRKIAPKCIIETVSYEWNRMLINELAHEHGIPVVELQHGSIDPDHAAYHYKTDLHLAQLPDYLFTFSEYWNNIIHMPSESTSCIAVGFPFFEAEVEKYCKESYETDKHTRILFISQPTVGEALSRAAVYCFQNLGSDRFRIVYKLHPHEYTDWKEKYPWLSNESGKGLTVIDNNKKSIYAYQARSDIQVGVYSTAIYEGFGFNLYTILYCEKNTDNIPPLAKMGYAALAYTPEGLFEAIMNQKSEYTNGKQNFQCVFWKNDSLSNIKQELKKIIS